MAVAPEPTRNDFLWLQAVLDIGQAYQTFFQKH